MIVLWNRVRATESGRIKWQVGDGWDDVVALILLALLAIERLNRETFIEKELYRILRMIETNPPEGV